MQYRLRNELARRWAATGDELRFHLFSAAARILPTHNAAVRRAFEGVLARAASACICDAEVTQVAAGRLQVRGGTTLDADEIVWVTQAGGAAWLRTRAWRWTTPASSASRDPAKRNRPADLRRRRLRRDDRPIRWKRPACSPCAWARRWPKTCAAASPAREPCASYRPQRAGWP
jgi:hypothetical protein